MVDDRGIFIGIVRRQAIIRYCYDKSRKIEMTRTGRPMKGSWLAYIKKSQNEGAAQ